MPVLQWFCVILHAKVRERDEFDKHIKTCVYVANEGAGTASDAGRAAAEAGADTSFAGSKRELPKPRMLRRWCSATRH